MENYILKLNSGTEYKLYKGATLVSDADLTTLFGAAGEMYLSFDFNSGTPSALTTFTITDSSDNAVITNTDVTIVEGDNYKATWANSATTFDTFEKLEGKALDESQLSFLMEKIKGAVDIKTYENTDRGGIIATNDYGNPQDIFWIHVNDSNVFKISPHGDASRYITWNPSSGRYLLVIRSSYTIYGVPESGRFGLYMYSGADLNQRRFVTTNEIPSIVDNLTSTSSTQPLSANQGRILNNRIGTLSTLNTAAKTSAVAAINEVNAKVLSNAGAPTTATVGTVGQLLVDTTNGKLYICTDATDPYVWEEVGAGGGSGIPTDATFWGASYDSTNNKVTGMISFDETGAGSVRRYIQPSGSNTLKLNAPSAGTIDFAINGSAKVSVSTNGANLHNHRIYNLADPTNAQDAATKNYVDTAVASAGGTAYTPGEFSHIWQEA